MSTAWVRADAFERLPGVCAKTGEPTELRAGSVADYVPAGLRWMATLGAWSFLFARSASRRRRVVQVPLSRRVLRSGNRWRRGSVALAGVAALAASAGSLGGREIVAFVGWMVVVATVAIGGAAWRRRSVGLFVDRGGLEIIVTRCHPVFAREAGRLAATSARPGPTRRGGAGSPRRR